MKRYLKIGAVVLAALVFSSCSAERKLNRLIKKHPELVKDTTITDYDTTFVHIEGVSTDSTIHVNTFMHDTVYLKQDRLQVKTYVYNDSVYIEGECLEIIDTVVSVEQIRVPYVVNKQAESNYFLWLIALIIGGYVIYRELKPRK